MKKFLIFLLIIYSIFTFSQNKKQELPWSNGALQVSANHRYLQHKNGKPFFWLGETGWLLPERTDRDGVDFYLSQCAKNGFNVVQVQTINAVPAYNKYGQPSMTDGFDFSNINQKGVYGYWDHMDYIVKTAEKNGIYIGMVCIWGGLVKAGKMDVNQAKKYGQFLAERYKDSPNIIWFIGGDMRGDIKKEVWEALANSIKAVDQNHLMTYHPFGATSSADWFNSADWLDFNMFQSGHRRYGQRKGDGNFNNMTNVEEDNWRYTEKALSMKPLKPIIDGEPSYEDIPQGLHDAIEPRWKDHDVRRYAYWSVFAGSFGHTYGHNSIMQFYRPGLSPAYGAQRAWYDCLTDAGFTQMQYLKNLMLKFPYFERIPDQSIIKGEAGERYERLIATRGADYLLVYNYTGRNMHIDLSKISGKKKKCWWYNPRTGGYKYIGESDGNKILQITPEKENGEAKDFVFVAVNASKNYLQ
jgi:hypothetical protein